MIVLDGRWQDWATDGRPTAITIGVLDGVHLGHRALLRSLDPELVATVLTFEPHPVEVLRPGTEPRLITQMDERISLLGQLGVAIVGVLDLAEIKEQAPEQFVEQILVERLGLGQLVVGVDFRFGKDRRGDIDLLTTLGSDLGFEVHPIDLVSDPTGTISSSRIRALIESGDVAAASLLMGSRFTLSNIVVTGDERGRELGFPTANLEPPPRKVIPGRGIYACLASVGGEVHQAAVNVGVRPTFGEGALVVEAYLLDFDADLYGQSLTLEFVEKLRPELKFDDVTSLIDQMREDVSRTRIVLSSASSRV